KSNDLLDRNRQLSSQTDDLKKTVAALQGTINEKIRKTQELEEELTKKKEGELAFAAGEVIGYRRLDPEVGDEDLTGEFRKLITQVITISQAKGAIPRSFDLIWEESEPQRVKLVEFCQKVTEADKDAELVVLVYCQQNVFKGENLGRISFTLEKNRVVQTGDYLFSVKDLVLDGAADREETALFLKYIFNHLREYLLERGMVEADLINEIEFYDTINYIKGLGEKVRIYIYFKDDIYLYTPDLNEKYKIIIERLGENGDVQDRSEESVGAELETFPASDNSRIILQYPQDSPGQGQ
ncbi:MAG: hypothetical protein PHQ23_07615, partial [Candidatus Wallbacteria bacterium]|nr:hypothetical protein [Candidatus Wallbacteria bacterium]